MTLHDEKTEVFRVGKGTPNYGRARAASLVDEIRASGFEGELVTLLQAVRDIGDSDGGNGRRGHPIMRGFAKWLGTAVLILAAAYGGIQVAISENKERIEEHARLPTHPGAAPSAELRALERAVDRIGAKIDEQAKAQEQRHADIRDELRFLRRKRR